jgi:ABC-type multidrug transport system ATPase subunit
MARTMLTCERLMRVFRDGGRRHVALDDVSFTLRAGEVVAITGANGAGKSTLLRLAAGLDRPTSGSVRRDAAIGWLGQDEGLYDPLTARENLAFVARFHGRVAEVERIAGILDVALDERASALSRGERQRAAIARAALGGPLMLLDEPTTGLDADGRARLIELLAGRTALVATHDEELAKRCDRVLSLSEGRIV